MMAFWAVARAAHREAAGSVGGSLFAKSGLVVFFVVVFVLNIDTAFFD
jgi:hypothetical protein